MNFPTGKDRLYSNRTGLVSDFVFDENVANVFNDMIQRSVPGYESIISMIAVLAKQYAQPGSRCYDLGCSTGAVTYSLACGIQDGDCRIIAVDNSQAMLDCCQKNLQQHETSLPIELMCADIRDVEFSDASVVVLNFTLQFVEPGDRAALIKKIYDGMLPGGVLILSEKISFDDPQEETFQIDMHHNFKKLNGYSDLEISQKRTALENVLIPETLGVHRQRLQKAGFKKNRLWFQSFNFVSLVAFK